ncbi:MAG: hypothetical protein K0R00_1845 [Herbinix sp.]|jgi:hypothetical protein|nr:hypothetical protein [Herbinix sp.]
MNTLKDALLTAAGDLEEKLSFELDSNRFPRHHFSRRYRRRKKELLKMQNSKPFPISLQWQQLLLLSLFVVCSFILWNAQLVDKNRV